MAEYIERTEALEITTRTCGDYAAAWSEIRKLPAADIAPVRHGKWLHTDYALHWTAKDECSECTYHALDRDDLSHYNYCPNCGAIMDMEE